MNFIPISILAYTLLASSTLISKIQLQTTLPKPLVYTFYTGLLQLLALLLIPFGFSFSIPAPALIFSTLSGLSFIIAIYTFSRLLKNNETSVVSLVVGTFNPLWSLSLGLLFFQQALTQTQLFALFVLLLGTLVLTANLWLGKISFGKQFLLMTLSGLIFGLSYLFLNQAFMYTNFITGLVVSRLAAGLVILPLLLIPFIKKELFTPFKQSTKAASTALLLTLGQALGGGANFLLFYAVSLANPALVNSFFGVQYLIILGAAFFFSKNHPNLLEEKLSKSVILQKIAGAGVISGGLYLLTS